MYRLQHVLIIKLYKYLKLLIYYGIVKFYFIQTLTADNNGLKCFIFTGDISYVRTFSWYSL